MSRHSVLCRDSEARHCIAIRLCVHDRDALLRQCGVVLRHDREGHARTVDQAERARQGWALMTEVFCHDRDISVAIDLLQW